MDTTTLASPWIRYVNRVKALFAHDDEVLVEYDDEGKEVTLYVVSQDKADALSMLMPSLIEFGNVTLTVTVKPCNDSPREEDLYRKAFAGNPAFVDVAEGFGPAQDVSYALFQPEVVQLRDDDLSEFGGLATITYAELAKAVLDAGNVRISSAKLASES